MHAGLQVGGVWWGWIACLPLSLFACLLFTLISRPPGAQPPLLPSLTHPPPPPFSLSLWSELHREASGHLDGANLASLHGEVSVWGGGAGGSGHFDGANLAPLHGQVTEEGGVLRSPSS